MTTTEPEGTAKPFAAFLQEHRGGAAHAEWTDALRQLVEAVTTFGKPGAMTVKIAIKPVDEGAVAMQVSDDVSLKLPTAPRGSSLFFATDDHNLSREDPRQQSLPLREVPAIGKDRASGE